MTHLYRHFDSSGALLYVGISVSALQRLKAHRDGSAWFDSIARVEIQAFTSRQEAEAAERAAIQSEKPRWNIRHVAPAKAPSVRPQRRPSGISPSAVVTHFGGVARAAAALKVTRQAVYSWLYQQSIPERRAYHIQVVTNGALKVGK